MFIGKGLSIFLTKYRLESKIQRPLMCCGMDGLPLLSTSKYLEESVTLKEMKKIYIFLIQGLMKESSLAIEQEGRLIDVTIRDSRR